MGKPLPFPCPAGYRHFDRVSQDDCYPCIRFLYRLDAARAAVSSGEPFHESRYREHDDEGNHIWDHPVSPAPVPAAGLPPPDPSLIGTEYHPISIDGGRYHDAARAAAPLDVERLAEAIWLVQHNTAAEHYDRNVPPGSPHRAEVDELGEQVAHEYEALTQREHERAYERGETHP